MTPDEHASGWLPYAFGFIQTSVLGLVGYVSKLLRDLRRDTNEARKDVNEIKTEIAKQAVELRMSREEHARRLAELERKDK